MDLKNNNKLMVKSMKKYNNRTINNQTNLNKLKMQNKNKDKKMKKTKLLMVLSSSSRIMSLQMKSTVCVGVFQSGASA